MPNCYYYDEQRNHCNCYLNENLNELLEENVNLRVQRANAMVTVRLVDERCAKLRELVADMLHDAMENVCSKAYWCDKKNWQTCNDKSCGNHLYVDMARELGVEVEK